MDDAPALENSYLRNWFADTRSASEEVRELFGQLSQEQSVWRPGPKSWSVAECFSHLVQTADLYHPPLVSALEELAHHGGPREPDKPFRARWFQGWFIGQVGPQAKRKIKAFKVFEPSAAQIDPARVEAQFLLKQNELGELIRKADGLDLNQGRVPSPITRLLSFTLGETFWLLTDHTQRHLLQAQGLRRLEGFPAS